jgi:small subunit ribosomal protein S16
MRFNHLTNATDCRSTSTERNYNAVVIRMARAGTKKRPFYHIVAADSRAPRDGRFIERLGYFNPLLPKDKEDRLKLDMDKVKAWIGKGAQPSGPRDALPSTPPASPSARSATIPSRRSRARSARPPVKKSRRSADAAKTEAKPRPTPWAAKRLSLSKPPKRSRHVGRRDRPHLRCPDRRRARHSRRGEAAVIHRGPDGDHGPMVRSKARTARGAFTIEALRPAKGSLRGAACRRA